MMMKLDRATLLKVNPYLGGDDDDDVDDDDGVDDDDDG